MRPILFFNFVGWWGRCFYFCYNPIMHHNKHIFHPMWGSSQRHKAPSLLGLLRWTRRTSALLRTPYALECRVLLWGWGAAPPEIWAWTISNTTLGGSTPSRSVNSFAWRALCPRAAADCRKKSGSIHKLTLSLILFRFQHRSNFSIYSSAQQLFSLISHLLEASQHNMLSTKLNQYPH